MRTNIGTKLIVAFILVVLLMVALTLYSVNVSQKSLRESVGKSSIFLAQEMLKRMNHDVYLKIEKLRTHSSNLFLQNILTESNSEFEKLGSVEQHLKQKDREWVSAPKDERTSFVQELISNELSNSLRREFIEFYKKRYGYGVFEEVFVTNKYGANVAQTGKTSDYRQDDEKWWQITREGALYLSDVEYDESATTHALSIGVRVDDEKGNFIGVMKAVVAVKGIIREAEITTKKYETTEIKLATKDGRLIYATKAFKFLEDISEKEFFKEIKGESDFFIAEEGGIERLYSYARSKGYRDFEGLGWILVMGHDVEEVLKPAFVLRKSMVAASLILIAIGCIIAFFMSFSITRPIAKLTKSAEIIGTGDLEYRVEVKTKDEIGELAVAFNQMAERRQRAEEGLRRREKEMNLIAENVPALFSYVGADGRYRFVNKRYEEWFGIPRIEIIGKHYREVLGEASYELIKDRVDSVLSDHRVCYEEALPYIHGGTRWVIADYVPDADERGKVKGFFALITDITERKRMEEALKVSAMEWRASFDAISDAVCLLEPKGRILRCNKAMVKFLGKPPSEIIGRTCHELIHGKSEPIEGCPIVRMRETRHRETMVLPIDDQWFNVSVDPLLDEADNLIGAVHIMADITEHKRVEEALRESEEKFRLSFENAKDAIFWANSETGLIINCNRAAEILLEKNREEIVGSHQTTLHPPQKAEYFASMFKRHIEQKGTADDEAEVITKSGKIIPIHITASVTSVGGKRIIQGIFRDIAERKNHENQRRLLSDRIIMAQERERTLIARELHDELGQALTGIKMDMAWIKNHMEGPDEAVSQRFVALGELIDSTIESVQEMASSLRPSILDRLGLVAAIEWHVGKFERRTGIECIIESEAPDFKINKKIAINAYRIVQEALTNVARHARASHVDILMAEERGYLTISISDNGRGIASDKLSGPTSLGIAGMRERAELVNGSLDIQSQRGEGTRVIAYLPLSSKGSKV